jgi:ankyrin repeat protein
MKVAPLHSAVAEKEPESRYEIAKLLLEHGANPNVRQQDDYTPLMAADQQGDARLRELLVEHGAIK